MNRKGTVLGAKRHEFESSNTVDNRMYVTQSKHSLWG